MLLLTVLKIKWANHAPAPVFCIPIPSVIAPPYSKMIPQGTRFSTSFHEMQPVKNNSTLPRIAIAAKPKYWYDENVIHNETVSNNIIRTISSFFLIFPVRLTWLFISFFAAVTFFISNGNEICKTIQTNGREISTTGME